MQFVHPLFSHTNSPNLKHRFQQVTISSKFNTFCTLIKILVVFLTVIPLRVLFPKTSEIKFEHYSVDQGLSQNRINFIYQDQLGFLWFGTGEGLTRFDGYRFENFNFQPGSNFTFSPINCEGLEPLQGFGYSLYCFTCKFNFHE